MIPQQQIIPLTTEALYALHRAYDAAIFDMRVSLVKFTGCIEMGLPVSQEDLREYRERCKRLHEVLNEIEQAEQQVVAREQSNG